MVCSDQILLASFSEKGIDGSYTWIAMDYFLLIPDRQRWAVFIALISLYIIIFIPSHMFLLGRTSSGLAIVPALVIGIFLGLRYWLLFGCLIFPINLVLSYFLDQDFSMNFHGLTGRNTFMLHTLVIIIGGTVGKISDLNKVLQKANEEIMELRGIIPICSNCKDIRNDDGFWTKVETYFEDHTSSHFTHSLCKKCEEQLYGDQDWYKKEKIIVIFLQRNVLLKLFLKTDFSNKSCSVTRFTSPAS